MISKLYRILTFTLIAISVQAQEIIFSENFDECVLTDKWSIDLKGNQDVSWGVGIPPNPKADGLSINGSCMLYIDDDLTGDKTAPFVLRITSEWFDGSGFSDLIFKALVHFRRDKTELLRIIIDNGQSEHVLREFRNSNFLGSKFSDYGQIMADISFIATERMRIVIEYDDDNVWGWWAGIDNIEVTGIRGGDIVMGHNFNDCILPAGWQTEILTGIDNWQFGKFHDGKTIDGSCFVYFNDDILGQNNPRSKIRLYSPFFDASEYSEYIMTYDLTYRTYEATEYLQLYVDNGEAWTPVKTYTTDFGGPEINKSKRDSIRLSAFRSDSLRLIWEYNDGGWAWWVGMDNVKITGSGSINDRCDKAIFLGVNDGCISFDNTNALSSSEAGFPSLQNAHGYLYYKLDIEDLTDYTITTNSSFNDRIEIFYGTCSEATRQDLVNRDEYGFKGESFTFRPQTDFSYFARISGYQAEFGFIAGKGCIQLEKKTDTTAISLYDKCESAVTLTLDQECISMNNVKAAMDGPFPTDNPRSRSDVWFKFIPEASGDYLFINESNFAESLAVFSGSCNEPEELISAYEGRQIGIKNAVNQKTYFIQVSGYFSTLEGTICGKIISQQANIPLNDNCSNAIHVPLNNLCSNVSNAGASFSGIRPTCDVYSFSDVWFSFNPDTSGNVFIRAKTEFEQILSIYEGSCNGLKSIHCENRGHYCDGYIHLTGLKPGSTYYIQIGARNTQTRIREGDICLEINSTAPDLQKLSLEITQECVSKGAVLFTPSTTGGNGIIAVEGPGIDFPVPGGTTYYIEAKDKDGCITSIPVAAFSCVDFGCTIAVTPLRKNVSCFGMNDGSIDLDISGGLGTYNVVWNNGKAGKKIDQINAGVYTATITDGSGCELSVSYSINQPAQIVTNYEITTPKCHGDPTGAISLFVTGGVSPFQYLWSDGSTTESLINIKAGQYDLVIKDDTDCTIYESFTIAEPDSLYVLSDIGHVVCPGDATGSIGISIKGGTLPFKILWEDNSSSMFRNDLAVGAYSVSVTDANNCLFTEHFSLISPTTFMLNVESAVLVITDEVPAHISTTMSGGTPPYQFEWLKDEVETGNYLSSLITNEPGVYQLIVKDNSDCIFRSELWTVSKISSTDDSDASLKFQIYPNPAANFLMLSFDYLAAQGEVTISDIFGKVLRIIDLKDIDGNNISINTSQLPPGAYTIKLRQGTKTASSGFVKIR